MKKRYTKRKLKQCVDEYIESEGIKSIAGLAIFLGINKEELETLSPQEDAGYSDIIAFAKTVIEKDIVENGLRGKYNATMSSFLLKTCFGYSDKQDNAVMKPVRIEVADELDQYSD